MPPKLKIYDEDGKREVDLIYDKVSFGRDAKCTVQIHDTMSSREHCVIERSGPDWRLRDCESRNGTKVNGAAISEHKLSHGDEVQIGDVVIRFEVPGGGSGRRAKSGAGGGNKRPSSPANKRPSKMTSAARRPRAHARGGGNTAAIGGILGVVTLLVVVALIMSSGSGGPSDQRLLDQAAHAVRTEDFDKAARRLRQVKNKSSSRYAEIKADLARAKEDAASRVDEQEAERAWHRLELRIAKKELKPLKAMSSLKRFAEDFPGTRFASKAKNMLRKMEKEHGASGGDAAGDGGDDGPPRMDGGDMGGGDDGPPRTDGGEMGGGPGGDGGELNGDVAGTIDEQVKKLVARSEYEEAISRLRDHFNKTADTSVTKKIEEVEKQADREWERIKTQARIAVAARNVARARSLLMSVKNRFGGRWADEADDELGKLPAD